MIEMRYAVVFETASGSPSVNGYVPDLPGCVATGQSVEEVRALLQEAIRMHIAGMRQDGEPIPEPSSTVDYVEYVEA